MKRNFSAQGYYHIYNRGTLKQQLFFDNGDYCRFVLLLLSVQGDFSARNLSRFVKQGKMSEVINYINENKTEIGKGRLVEIFNFCIMPNHFHMTLHELQEGGISRYMHKLLNSYSQYFNKKYDKNGHVFQGPYKCVHVFDDNQINYLSAYIHLNPIELQEWKNNPETYPWSSYQDYTEQNRWGNILETQFILEAHSKTNDYKKFVQASGAKIKKEKGLFI